MNTKSKATAILEQHRFSLNNLEEKMHVLSTEVHEDELDGLLSQIISELIGAGRLVEAELVIPRISSDWASVKAESWAALAEAYFASENPPGHTLALLVRALRSSSSCDDWKWVEAETMARVAAASARVGELAWARAVYLEAASIAKEEVGKQLGERSIDATGVVVLIAHALSDLGHHDDALEVAALIESPCKREQLIEELADAR